MGDKPARPHGHRLALRKDHCDGSRVKEADMEILFLPKHSWCGNSGHAAGTRLLSPDLGAAGFPGGASELWGTGWLEAWGPQPRGH